MPEIGEVARIVHYLKKHVAGRTIAAVKVQEDNIVYGKVGTSASAFQKAMAGKKVLDAKQQGKYFWLVMSEPPHPLMHFGMSGWMKFSNDDTSYYKPTKKEDDDWPPKYWKFVLEMAGDPKCEVAFVDPRRLARVRLVDAKADEMRNTTPLKENGPDPVVDKDILTREWLAKKMTSKRVPVKALLLDQANISGVGNWVADEVLYQARIHPEQYSNTFSDAQLKQLHDSLTEVCTTAVGTLADSSKFPESWLMRHRWGKGKKNGNKLPNGDKIVFLTVGGRTSAVVPSVQKKTGAVAGDVSAGANAEAASDAPDGEEEAAAKPPKAKLQRSGKRGAKRTKADGEEEEEMTSDKPSKRGRTRKSTKAQREDESELSEPEEDVEEQKPAPKPRRKTASQKVTAKGVASKNTSSGTAKNTGVDDTTGRRRSARISK